jgi:hypothetical protein
MQRLKSAASLVLSTLVLSALLPLQPAFAQQSNQDMVAFKVNVSGPLPEVLAFIPGNPSIAVHSQKLTGEADFMGAVSWIDLHPVYVSDDGKPIGQPFGQGAITAANGDALYFTWSGPAWNVATGGQCMHMFIVTGGKGRFKGATGYGLLRGEGNVNTKKVTISVEATISRPAPAQQ